MKKLGVFGLMALVVLVGCFFVACSTDSGSKTDKLVFTDTTVGAAKDFTVDSNFGFVVKFNDPALGGLIAKGDTISGKVTGVTGAWNSDYTGVAQNMKTNNANLSGTMGTMEVAISVIFTKGADNAITAITVHFPDAATGDTNSIAAEGMMGGTYNLK